MLGYIYIVTDSGKPGVVSVGATGIAPDARSMARGQNSKFRIAYNALVENACDVEASARQLLSANAIDCGTRFECSTYAAVQAIKEAAQNQLITEQYNDTSVLH